MQPLDHYAIVVVLYPFLACHTISYVHLRGRGVMGSTDAATLLQGVRLTLYGPGDEDLYGHRVGF